MQPATAAAGPVQRRVRRPPALTSSGPALCRTPSPPARRPPPPVAPPSGRTPGSRCRPRSADHAAECLPSLADTNHTFPLRPLSPVQYLTWVPSGLKAIPMTVNQAPRQVATCLPAAKSHSRSTPSPPPTASIRPSGLNATRVKVLARSAVGNLVAFPDPRSSKWTVMIWSKSAGFSAQASRPWSGLRARAVASAPQPVLPAVGELARLVQAGAVHEHRRPLPVHSHPLQLLPSPVGPEGRAEDRELPGTGRGERLERVPGGPERLAPQLAEGHVHEVGPGRVEGRWPPKFRPALGGRGHTFVDRVGLGRVPDGQAPFLPTAVMGGQVAAGRVEPDPRRIAKAADRPGGWQREGGDRFLGRRGGRDDQDEHREAGESREVLPESHQRTPRPG
jgi:hypothetical protein